MSTHYLPVPIFLVLYVMFSLASYVVVGYVTQRMQYGKV